MNLLVNAIVTDNQRINRELNEQDYTLAPDYNDKNYKTDSGYKAVVQDYTGDDLMLIIEDGKTVDRQPIYF